MLRLLYSALLYVVAPLAFAATALRGLRDPAYRDRLPERFGFTRVRFAAPADLDPRCLGRRSAGRGGARARTADRAIRSIRSWSPRRRRPARSECAHCSATRCGMPTCPTTCRARCGDFSIARTPPLAIVMEREIWPNLFRACSARRIPILLASARISERSGRRHLRLAGLFRDALARDVTIAAQTDADAERFRAIGVPAAAVHVTGNIKFDLEIPAGRATRRRAHCARAVRAIGRCGLRAARTKARKTSCSMRTSACARRATMRCCVLVPRHPNRFDAVKSWLQCAQRSLRLALDARSGRGGYVGAAGRYARRVAELLCRGERRVRRRQSRAGRRTQSARARGVESTDHRRSAQLQRRGHRAGFSRERGLPCRLSRQRELGSAVLDLLTNAARRDKMIASAHAILQTNRGALARLLTLIEKLLRR